MHVELALCERNVDADRTKGERAAGIHKTRIERRLDADQTHTEPGSALNTETIIASECVSGLRSFRVWSSFSPCSL